MYVHRRDRIGGVKCRELPARGRGFAVHRNLADLAVQRRSRGVDITEEHEAFAERRARSLKFKALRKEVISGHDSASDPPRSGC